MVERTQPPNQLARRNHEHQNNMTSNHVQKSHEENHRTITNVHSFPKTDLWRDLQQLWTPLREPPLSDNDEILWSIYKDDNKEETNLWHVRSYLEKDDILKEEEQERVWVRTKTFISQGLAHDAETKKTKTKLPKEYEEYKTVFKKKASEHFSVKKPWDHAIDLKPDFIPKNCKVYPMSPENKRNLTSLPMKTSAKKYIRLSKSPQALPFFFIFEKDSGKLRPCQDYQRLNDWTIKNAYPLPCVGDLLDKLKGAKYYTKFDLWWGYNNVRIKEGDKWKAAFKMNKGLFEPTVIFFSLCNSPSTFQNMMNNIFKNEINEGWLLIYMDDILIFTNDHSKMEEYMKRVLQKLHDNDLFLNLNKYVFDVTEVEYLGLIIKENEIAMEPTKLARIADWPASTAVKQVQSFLRFANFYRRFIGKFADISLPLTALTKKDLTWNWTTECQDTFDTLKRKFQEAPILLMPDNKKPFILETDASKWAPGGVLWQQDINGDWHPCRFISYTFNPTERNYKIYDWELLSIIQGLETWHHYLHRSPSHTVILLDHKISHTSKRPRNWTDDKPNGVFTCQNLT